MTSTPSTIRSWNAVFMCAAFALLFSFVPPAGAHCDGVRHGSGHPHCDTGEPPPPPSAFNPELVWLEGTTTKNGPHIVIANRDGTSPTTIFSNPEGSIGSVSWSPGGLEILFGASGGPQGAGIYRLPIFDGEADESHPRGNFSVGAPTLVVPLPPDTFVQAFWSPVPALDSNYWIAFMLRFEEAFLFNPAGGQLIPLTSSPRTAGKLSWSHDAKRIALQTWEDGNFPVDIEVFSLATDGSGLVVTDHVSLFLNNGFINPGSNAEVLANTELGQIDWANTKNELAVRTLDNDKSTFWIVPVPDAASESLQEAVANGTVVAITDEVNRAFPRWSPDDTALLYRRTGSGGICDAPVSSGKGKGKVAQNFVIGALDNGAPNDDPNKIECDDPSDETTLDVTGVWPEWWRGPLPDGVLPPPLP